MAAKSYVIALEAALGPRQRPIVPRHGLAPSPGKLKRNDLTLRSGAQDRVSKGGHEHLVCGPSFETALRASSG